MPVPSTVVNAIHFIRLEADLNIELQKFEKSKRATFSEFPSNLNSVTCRSLEGSCSDTG
jgi:hypothetical protein